jgi:hypothetical protein
MTSPQKRRTDPAPAMTPRQQANAALTALAAAAVEFTDDERRGLSTPQVQRILSAARVYARAAKAARLLP